MNEEKNIPAAHRQSLPVSLPVEYYDRYRSSVPIDYSKNNSNKVSQKPEPRVAQETPKFNLQQKGLENLQMAMKMHSTDTNFVARQITRATNTEEFVSLEIVKKIEKIAEHVEKIEKIVEKKPSTSTVGIQTDDINIIEPEDMANYKEFRKSKDTKPGDFFAEFNSYGERFKEFFSELYNMCNFFFKEYTGIDNRTYTCSKEKRHSFLKIIKELITMITIPDDVKQIHTNKKDITLVDHVPQENKNNNYFLNDNNIEKVKDSTHQSEIIEIHEQTQPRKEQEISEQEHQNTLEQALAYEHFDHNIVEPKDVQPHKELQNKNQFMVQRNNMKFQQNNFINNTQLSQSSSSVSQPPQRTQYLHTQPTQALQQFQQNQQPQMHPNTNVYCDQQSKVHRHAGKSNVRDTPYHQRAQKHGKKVWQQQSFEHVMQAPPPQIPYYQQNQQQMFQQQMYYQQNSNAP